VSPETTDVLSKGLYNGFKDVFNEFFSTKKQWTMRRNIIGALLVYIPEIPAYFIPSYTQAKQTGNAKDLKKGEGIRGLVTGGLEGMAVGAIVSKETIKVGKLIPFAIFGAAVQFMSSMLLPRVGEKVGKYVYNKRAYANKIDGAIEIPLGSEPMQTQLTTPNSNSPQFKGKMPYSRISGTSLRI